MGLRPARTFRGGRKLAWTRFSRSVPRKSYVKSMPHNALTIYEMGNAKLQYDCTVDLVSEGTLQVRDNALESARQAVNKFLEKNIPNAYRFRIVVFPHNVIRENKMIAGAGADRLQSGMAHPYGRPTERGAILRPGQKVFTIDAFSKDLELVKEAFRRGKGKMGGLFRVVVTPKAAS